MGLLSFDLNHFHRPLLIRHELAIVSIDVILWRIQGNAMMLLPIHHIFNQFFIVLLYQHNSTFTRTEQQKKA